LQDGENADPSRHEGDFDAGCELPALFPWIASPVVESVPLENGIVAIVAVVAGVGLGVLLRLLFGRLQRRAVSTTWSGDELIFGLLHDLAVPLLTLGGLWIAVGELRLHPRWHDLAVGFLSAALILVATLMVARLAAEAIRATMVRRTGGGSTASIFVNITRLAILLIGALLLLDNVGVSIAPLITALGVGGLAVALALQDTLANLFAGVHILASKKVQVGDFIRLDTGEEGQIVDINWRNTTVQQVQNNQAIIPNAKLAESILINYFRPEPEMSVVVPVGVAYGSDLDKVEQVTREVGAEVMREMPGGVEEHEPVIRFSKFGESSVDLNVILRTREFAQQYLIVSEFVRRLHARYQREGIQIPFPVRTILLDDDNRLPARTGAETV
jgi:small-conductance mechanosensitive channel